MRVRTIARNIDLEGPGASQGSAIDLLSEPMPFQPGATAVVALHASAWLEAEQDAVVLALEGRETETGNWETLASLGGADQPAKYQEVVLTRYVRWNNEGASSADGRGSIHLLGN